MPNSKVKNRHRVCEFLKIKYRCPFNYPVLYDCPEHLALLQEQFARESRKDPTGNDDDEDVLNANVEDFNNNFESNRIVEVDKSKPKIDIFSKNFHPNKNDTLVQNPARKSQIQFLTINDFTENDPLPDKNKDLSSDKDYLLPIHRPPLTSPPIHGYFLRRPSHCGSKGKEKK